MAQGKRTNQGQRQQNGSEGTRRRSSERQSGKAPSRESGFRVEIILIVACAIALFLILSNFGVCGAVGNAISGFFFGVFGVVQYILPLAAAAGIIFLHAQGYSGWAIRKVVYVGVLTLMISMISQMIVKLPQDVTVGDLYLSAYRDKVGGGLIAGGLALLLHKGIGTVGVWIVIVVVTLIMIVLLTEKSLIALLQRGGDRMMDDFHDMKERGEEYRDRRQEERLTTDELRKQKREEREEARKQKNEEKKNELELRRAAKEEAKAKAELEKEARENREPEYNRFHKKTDKSIMQNLTVFPGNSTGRTEDSEGTDAAETAKSQLKQEEVHEITMVFENPEQEEDYFTTNHSKVTDANQTVKQNAAAEDVKQNVRQNTVVPDVQSNDKQESAAHTAAVSMDKSGSRNIMDGVMSAEGRMSTKSITEKPADLTVQMELEDEDELPLQGMEEPDVSAPKKRVYKHTQQSRQDTEEAKNQVASDIAKKEAAEQTGHKQSVGHTGGSYQFPPLDLLTKGNGRQADNDVYIQDTIQKLQSTLNSFGVGATVTDYSCGPAVTRFELQPEQGVKVSKIVGLSDDIKLSLAATDIRIEAPIPGKSAIGIEIPNQENSAVLLRDLLEDKAFQDSTSPIAFGAGKDIAGQTVIADIAKMPHLLIAGATGSGKSVCINTIIMSILYKADPKAVKLIMVDPKVVELTAYNGIPHLLIPVVTDPKKAAGALNWAVQEMTKRYQLFADYNVRNLKGYNKKVDEVLESTGISEDESDIKHMPQIVVIVDELADLMMVAKGEVEDAIVRLAQLARAAGIHLIIATQRPSVDVITGLIKANVPSRIAFAVSSFIDSKTILDMGGAEKLLGKGDMLFYPTGFPKPVRVQGAFVSDEEVAAVVDFLKTNMEGSTSDSDVTSQIESSIASASVAAASEGSDDDKDEYFRKAAEIIIESDKASIGMLQRRLKIGFNRAARIMDQLAEAGIVGPDEGTKPRQILMSAEQFEQYVEEYL